MRVFLVGLACFITTTLAAILLLNGFSGGLPAFAGAAAVLVVFALVLWGSMKAFGFNFEGSIQKLEEKGLVITNEYVARRVFQVEEVEDEGSHYYLELEDGSVLYLTGQYLYDLEVPEEDHDDPNLDPATVFPSTAFTVKRHKKGGYGLQVIPRGAPLWPEELFPATYYERFFASPQGEGDELWHEDGEVITDISYDELKRRWRVASGA